MLQGPEKAHMNVEVWGLHRAVEVWGHRSGGAAQPCDAHAGRFCSSCRAG